MKAAPAAAQPDPWMQAMRAGDFAAAWRISDAVLEHRAAAGACDPEVPRHLQYVWRGEPLAGRHVLVRCYHGLGDTLQFARFLLPLATIAREVSVWVQPPLIGLLGSLPGGRRLLPLHDGAPDLRYDVDIEIMELAHALRADAAMIRGLVPYLSPPPSEAHGSKPAAVDSAPLRVGLAWRAGDWDRRRSVPDRILPGLTRSLPDVQWFSLHHPPDPLCGALGAADLGCADIAALAARLASLDLVISVDTMMAHLAGALGLPVWTLLHADCDWRWMEAREDSPWYPGMRLFRQPRPGAWDEVLDRLREALADLRVSADG